MRELHTLEKKVQSAVLHVALLLVAITMIVPFWWMVSTSMTENANTELATRPPRWHPWRTMNKAGAANGAAKFVIEGDTNEYGLELLNDGFAMADASWVSPVLPPDSGITLLLDLGSTTRISHVSLKSFRAADASARLKPEVILEFASDNVEKSWADTRVINSGSAPTEDGFTIEDRFEPRIVARHVRLTFVNRTKMALPVAWNEVEVTENLVASMDNYRQVLKVKDEDRAIYGFAGRFGRYYINSFIVAVLVTLSNLIFCSLAGYAFAKGKFIGRDAFFYALLATMMVPGQVTLIPVYAMMKNLGLLNNLASLILPGLAGVYGVFLCMQFIRQLPDSLLEAARIDGCSEFRIWWDVVLPLSKPVLATLGIVTFLANWNAFLGPFIMLNDEKWKTLPLGLVSYRQQYTAEWGNMMAASAITIVPILVVFVLLQKYVIKGMAHAGMKE